MFPFTWVF